MPASPRSLMVGASRGAPSTLRSTPAFPSDARVRNEAKMCITTPRTGALTDLYARLKATGRGKHIYPYSYYHRALVETVPGLTDEILAIRTHLRLSTSPFNVVKLDACNRISFLVYEPFNIAFPTLLATESCDLATSTVRRVRYAGRPNPPILHRKELLLPADHPLVPEAERLTSRLERMGALQDITTIGTRLRWRQRLAELRLDESGRSVT